MNELHKLLKLLDLDSQEIEVYSFLLQNGPSTILEISRSLSINRTNLYRVCEDLCGEGCINRIAEHNTTKFEAVSVDFLKYKIYEKRRKAGEIREKYDNIRDTLNTFSDSSGKRIRVVHYDGKEEVKQLLWNYLDTKGECLSFAFRTLSEAVGRNFVVKWWNKAKKRGIYDKMLANKGTFEMKNVVDKKAKSKLVYSIYEHVEERIIDEKIFKIYYETFIYNEVFAIVQWEGNLVFGVEVYSSVLSDFKKKEFYTLWNLAKPKERINEED